MTRRSGLGGALLPPGMTRRSGLGGALLPPGMTRRSGLSGALLLLATTRALAAQHVHEPAPDGRTGVQLGAHAIALVSHVSPILQGEAKTEAYLTQPTLLGDAFLFGGMLRAQAAISLEPLTLERGELGAGNYGEGYIDRRHPHTYLHELVLTGTHGLGAAVFSATAGRGFAPFGTDDPMMRPFVKFPVNHHLGQILERLIAIVAVQAGPVLVEAGVFNGDEPLNTKHLGSLDRFGDSWSSRVTLLPVPGVELQASFAAVESPELHVGGGLDQRKLSASARYDRVHALGAVHALAEWARTTELDDGDELYSLGSILFETTLQRADWQPGLRLEYTERAEEARAFDPFRTPWPHAGSHVMGITRWLIIAARVERAVALGGLRVAPFIEVSHAHVSAGDDDVFEPAAFYGDTNIRTLNLGARMTLGSHRARMGRYGAALPTPGTGH